MKPNRHISVWKEMAAATFTEKEAKRFWAKVRLGKSDDCWEWFGCKDECGYGSFYYKRRIRRAHRVSYLVHRGPIPPRYIVMHSCDNPPCVNPAHLGLGTQRDNVEDCMLKNRRAHLTGSSHGMAIFTERQVTLIRAMHKELGIAPIQIAEWCGVTPTTIHSMLKGKNWSSV